MDSGRSERSFCLLNKFLKTWKNKKDKIVNTYSIVSRLISDIKNANHTIGTKPHEKHLNM